jgi:hypothetical protein
MRPQTLLAAVGVSLLLHGCDENDDFDARDRGELGNGHFVYECLNDTDSACADGGTATLPQAMAVGGRFAMRFPVVSGAQPTVIAPAPSFVRPAGAGFEVLREGQFVMLAVNGNTEVVDLKHLRAANTAEVRVQAGNQPPVARLVLAEGQTLSLLAAPFDRDGVKLGGSLVYTWRSSDASCVSVDSLAQLNRVTVRARGACVASLITEVAGTAFSVAVQVGGVLPDAGAGADAGPPISIDAGSTDVGTLDARVAPNDSAADGGVQ